MRQGKIKYAFPGSNTAEGFQSFYRENLADLEQVITLKGGPGSGKSTIIKKISMAMIERGYDVELWQCSSDNDSLDGVMVPALKVAVVDGTYPHVLDPIYPGAAGEWINLGEFWDDAYLWTRKKEIIAVNKEVSGYFAAAYGELAKAFTVLKEIEAAKTALEDEGKIASLAEQWLGLIFAPEKTAPRHLFASAITPGGVVNMVQNITENCRERYILQGGSLAAKTKVLSRLVEQATLRGHRVTVYHMPLDPNQLEMVVLPDLGVAMLTEELFGKNATLQERDIPLSLVEIKRIEPGELGAVDAATSGSHVNISDQETQYEGFIQNAVDNLKRAKSRHDDLEAFYCQAMDYERIDTARNKIFNRILALAAEKEK
ncbi:MAG: hypothetical protein HFI72_01670 [Peptococcaceae bacterium]|jgi:hypothetical protein|nr:hypothetical protein [Peptococcaceae bacterium]